ncbi:hypothetical protein LINPERHAP1_LOCUS17150 [Linum perenne]
MGPKLSNRCLASPGALSPFPFISSFLWIVYFLGIAGESVTTIFLLLLIIICRFLNLKWLLCLSLVLVVRLGMRSGRSCPSSPPSLLKLKGSSVAFDCCGMIQTFPSRSLPRPTSSSIQRLSGNHASLLRRLSFMRRPPLRVGACFGTTCGVSLG